MLKWDGTFLQKIKKCNILQKFKFNKEQYWQLKIDKLEIQKLESSEELKDSLSDLKSDATFYCLAKSSKNTYPCIFDEFKPLFGLQKLGTHWILLGKQIYILIRVFKSKHLDIRVDPKLKDIAFDYDLNFKEKVKRIYAFRELFGITFSTHNSIRVRENFDSNTDVNSLDNFEPISFREPNANFEKAVISKVILKKLFENNYQNLIQYIYKLLGINKNQDYNSIIIKLSFKLENIIQRVDKNMISINNSIMTRINNFY